MTTRHIISLGLLLVSVAAIAQPPPPATPIDGGLGVLLAGGVAYGVKKVLDRRRNQ